MLGALEVQNAHTVGRTPWEGPVHPVQLNRYTRHVLFPIRAVGPKGPVHPLPGPFFLAPTTTHQSRPHHARTQNTRQHVAQCYVAPYMLHDSLVYVSINHMSVTYILSPGTTRSAGPASRLTTRSCPASWARCGGSPLPASTHPRGTSPWGRASKHREVGGLVRGLGCGTGGKLC